MGYNSMVQAHTKMMLMRMLVLMTMMVISHMDPTMSSTLDHPESTVTTVTLH